MSDFDDSNLNPMIATATATVPNRIVQSSIWVQFEKEGIHCYPAAGTDPNLADVSFLQYPHRHMFKFLVMISVEHDDRDIEFIQFKRWLTSLYDDGTLELNSKSCEMIARELFAKIDEKYPHRSVVINVSEDGENGAQLSWINIPDQMSIVS